MEAAPLKKTRGNRIHYDDEVKGFGGPGDGARAFVLNFRIGGIERPGTIGTFPACSVKAAREQAKERGREIKSGFDPLFEREKVRAK